MSKAKSRVRSGRAAKRGSRKTAPKVLVLCQGKITEVDYFSRLKSKYRQPFEVRPLAKGPQKMVEEAVRILGREDHEEIYIIVDVDLTTQREFDQAIAKCLNSRQQAIRMIVSNPCFEYWLLMHSQYKTGPQITRQQAQQQALKFGLVKENNPKEIETGFPVEEFEHAIRNGHVCEPNVVGQIPSTAVPHAVRRLVRLRP